MTPSPKRPAPRRLYLSQGWWDAHRDEEEPQTAFALLLLLAPRQFMPGADAEPVTTARRVATEADLPAAGRHPSGAFSVEPEKYLQEYAQRFDRRFTPPKPRNRPFVWPAHIRPPRKGKG